jgi:hypothetical protein
MFAEAAGWQRPIRFAGGVGGRLPAPAVAEAARRACASAGCSINFGSTPDLTWPDPTGP